MACINIPEGANYINKGPGMAVYIKMSGNTHDYWCASEKRWVTFEGAHNPVRKDWSKLAIEPTGLYSPLTK